MNETALFNTLLFAAIFLPALFGGLLLLVPKKAHGLHVGLLLLGFAANLALCFSLYGSAGAFEHEWLGFEINFSFRLYQFNGFLLLAAGVLSFLTALFTASFAWKRKYAKQLFSYMLFTVTLVNGALLANNLFVMLLFWQGILATLFGIIRLGSKDAYKTSVKAVILAGTGDLCLMFGIGLTEHAAHTLAMDAITKLPLSGMAGVGFVFFIIGILAKLGAMPFHTWQTDASHDAPAPFLAFLPGALEKLLGIYLLVRVCTGFFDLSSANGIQTLVMVLGACTLLFAAMSAIVQKDLKRLLTCVAISQAGLMLLSIGTASAMGTVGGVYTLLNFAVCQGLLFLAAAAVEKQAGTTELSALGGLIKKMPVTAVGFLLAAASVVGFPLTGGFFAGSLAYDAIRQSGSIYYIVALLSQFFVVAALLKALFAVFFGKGEKAGSVKEAPLIMLVSVAALALLSLALAVFHKSIVTGLVAPTLVDYASADTLSTHVNLLLTVLSVVVLALAALSHTYGAKKFGAAQSAGHFKSAPVLRTVYGMAEKKYFDPYYTGGFAIKAYAKASLFVNDAISRFYDVAVPRLTSALSGVVKRAHNGNQARYVGWVLFGMVLLTVLFVLFL